MRIATWNVERATDPEHPRSRRVVAQMERVGADVWILTETHEAIGPGVGYEAAGSERVVEPPTSHGPGERRVIVWSRWPIVRRVSGRCGGRVSFRSCSRPDALLGCFFLD